EEGFFNYQFLIDYFKPKKKKKKKKVNLYVENVTLKNSIFSYDDNRKERRTKGVDYFHIYGSKINLSVTDFKMKGLVFSGNITHLDCYEKSGFKLDELITSSVVSQDG